ncbi:Uncharacterized protein APZ42_009694, partial [Daphnia magna]
KCDPSHVILVGLSELKVTGKTNPLWLKRWYRGSTDYSTAPHRKKKSPHRTYRGHRFSHRGLVIIQSRSGNVSRTSVATLQVLTCSAGF